MKPLSIITTYIILLTIEFIFDWFISILNMNNSLKNRTKPPSIFKQHIEGLQYTKSVEYTLRKGKFGLLGSLEGKAIILAVLLSGASFHLEQLIARTQWSPYWQAFLFISVATLVIGVIKLPHAIYGIFVIEEEFGFNSTKPSTFLSDMIKQNIIGSIILMLILAGLYFIMSLSPRWWWFFSWIFLMTFQGIVVILYPLLIAPLFNKFQPIPEGDLKIRLNALASKCNFPNQGIFVMDGSRRSAHSNAYFTGLGRFRRIVIFDTLMKDLQDDELEAVLAHEIGHWKFGHIRQSIIFSGILLLIIFFLFGQVYQWPAFFIAFGFSNPSIYALLFWLTLYSSPFSQLLSPLFNSLSRRNEYAADRFALKTTDGSDALYRSLITMGRENLSNLSPHPAFSFWHYSHPALAERLEAIQKQHKINQES